MRRPLCFGTLGLVALALSIPAATAPLAGALDGKAFAATVGEAGKPSGEKDELIFKDGKFRSTACDRYGFRVAPYTTTTGPTGSTAFDATTVSPKEGKIHWQGQVRGDAVAGTYVWTKLGQKDIHYWFKGTARKLG